jgi:predicted nucleic acid-binding protein
MKVVIDNNIIIDALKPNPEFETEAKKIFQLAVVGTIKGYLCSNSLTDIFFIIKKVQGEALTKSKISDLMDLFSILPLTDKECKAALTLPMSDFEDAVIAVCADKIKADYIVSRDEKFIKAGTVVSVITPGELLKKL